MIDAPRQDWKAYEQRTREFDIEWLRSLSPADRFALYCDIFNLIRQGRDPKADEERLEELRWQQKLAARQCAVEAFQRLDAWRERTAQRHSH